MDIPTYLFMHKMLQKDFAKKLGVHRSLIWRYCKGLSWPSLLTAKKMEKISSGAIKPEDVLVGKPKPQVCECCGRRWRKKKTGKKVES